MKSIVLPLVNRMACMRSYKMLVLEQDRKGSNQNYNGSLGE
jgi:hypothetical protein